MVTLEVPGEICVPSDLHLIDSAEMPARSSSSRTWAAIFSLPNSNELSDTMWRYRSRRMSLGVRHRSRVRLGRGWMRRPIFLRGGLFFRRCSGDLRLGLGPRLALRVG